MLHLPRFVVLAVECFVALESRYFMFISVCSLELLPGYIWCSGTRLHVRASLNRNYTDTGTRKTEMKTTKSRTLGRFLPVPVGNQGL